MQREAAAKQDALALLSQGRRSGGLPGGELTRHGAVAHAVDPLPDDLQTFARVGHVVTGPMGGAGGSHATPGELAAVFASEARRRP